jgi:hypothetical protein
VGYVKNLFYSPKINVTLKNLGIALKIKQKVAYRLRRITLLATTFPIV